MLASIQRYKAISVFCLNIKSQYIELDISLARQFARDIAEPMRYKIHF